MGRIDASAQGAAEGRRFVGHGRAAPSRPGFAQLVPIERRSEG